MNGSARFLDEFENNILESTDQHNRLNVESMAMAGRYLRTRRFARKPHMNSSGSPRPHRLLKVEKSERMYTKLRCMPNGGAQPLSGF